MFQHGKSDKRTYENISKDKIGQWNEWKTSYLLDCLSYSKTSKLIAINLCIKQSLDTDQKVIQLINFTENKEHDEKIIMFTFDKIK